MKSHSVIPGQLKLIDASSSIHYTLCGEFTWDLALSQWYWYKLHSSGIWLRVGQLEYTYLSEKCSVLSSYISIVAEEPKYIYWLLQRGDLPF